MGGAHGETRTHDLYGRHLTLYPLSYGRTVLGLAEREGFEPSMQVTPHGGLANRCTRPLCDLSIAAAAGILSWALRATELAETDDVDAFPGCFEKVMPSERDEYMNAVTIGARTPVDGPIHLAEPDPAWPSFHEREADRVRDALGERFLLLKHVGSTWVPALPAKPMIDMVL